MPTQRKIPHGPKPILRWYSAGFLPSPLPAAGALSPGITRWRFMVRNLIRPSHTLTTTETEGQALSYSDSDNGVFWVAGRRCTLAGSGRNKPLGTGRAPGALVKAGPCLRRRLSIVLLACVRDHTVQHACLARVCTQDDADLWSAWAQGCPLLEAGSRKSRYEAYWRGRANCSFNYTSICQLLVCLPWWTLICAHLYGTRPTL